MKSPVLTFHGIYSNQDDFQFDGSIEKRSLILISDLEEIIVSLISKGYIFKKFSELNGTRKEICITFDDGYANNLLLRDLAQKYKIPFTIFVCGRFIEEVKMYWWDIQYNIGPVTKPFKIKKNYSAESLWNNYSAQKSDSLISQINRPLTIDELVSLSKDSFFEIGCHTYSHTIANRINAASFVKDVERSIAFIENVTGKRPRCFAFPDGDYVQDKLVVNFVKSQFDFVAVVNQKIGFNRDGFISRIMLKTTDKKLDNFYITVIQNDSRRFVIFLKRWLSVKVKS